LQTLNPPLFAGVDYGGSWIRIRLVDGRRRPLRTARLETAPLSKLPDILKKQFHRWNARPSVLVVGARGVWTRTERRTLKRRLSSAAGRTVVLSDIELAYRSLFRNRPGILVLAGTGSIAYGRNGKGRAARAGGLGPEKGDEGSGFWIGREWLKRNGTLKRKYSVRETAGWAEEVLLQARRKNPSALRIVGEAQAHLIRLAGTLRRKLGPKEQWSVACAGGLFEDRAFKRGFYARLNAAYGRTAVESRAKAGKPAETAAELALRLGTADPAFRLLNELEEVPDFGRR
jgi:N-acetylglucosamine kinase-like BadF-type ATPase